MDALFTHNVARASGKAPFFFSRFNFDRARRRGNTHYCFHCGGNWGFQPGPNREALNSKDDVMSLYRPDGKTVKVREALADPLLEPHLATTPGYKRRTPDDRQYEEWLDYQAHFDHTDAFEEAVVSAGYSVYRYDPMDKHDPATHANAIVGGIDKKRYMWASQWLEGEKLPEGFPYVVSIPN